MFLGRKTCQRILMWVRAIGIIGKDATAASTVVECAVDPAVLSIQDGASKSGKDFQAPHVDDNERARWRVAGWWIIGPWSASVSMMMMV